jgi:hypothetical protein
MWKPAKPSFSQLLDGQPAAKFDAKDVLKKRLEARRAQPFVPIQEFGLPLSEKMTAPIDWTGAVKPAGAGIQTQN